MAFLYFDESIRDRGEFIIGALVVSQQDLSPVVQERWRAIGLDSVASEYKSSDPKKGNATGKHQREIISDVLFASELALTVLPSCDRRELGSCCTRLVIQLNDTGMLKPNCHQLFVDQNISMSAADRVQLSGIGVKVHLNCDSRLIAGIQVADHAAHALGGMLMEELGLLEKKVAAGENSGYDPELMLDLGFELWASMRYALIGKNEHIAGLSPPPNDPVNPFFLVDGFGLHIAASCPDRLADHARRRFGVNYLGCIH